MPIFFHAESHLWIAYLFFANGALATYLLRHTSISYARLTVPIEARVVSAFLLSVSINGVVLWLLAAMELKFSTAIFVLPCLTAILLVVSIHKFDMLSRLVVRPDTKDTPMFLLYAFIFTVLFFNGGLIEQISDAWWHMSLANRIGWENSYTLESGHTTLGGTRYYPPLWHGNLALANALSGLPISQFWNSFTAWGGVLKLMAFYLFSLGLTGNRRIASLGTLLFLLLPGVGNSYMRVSAWPSHLAYTAWFVSLYVSFQMMESLSKLPNYSLSECVRALWSERVSVIVVVILLVIINFAHRLEILWYVLAFLFYFTALSVQRLFSKRESSQPPIEPDWISRFLGGVLLTGALTMSIVFLIDSWYQMAMLTDLSLAVILPIAILTFFLLLQTDWVRRTNTRTVVTRCVFAGVILLVVLTLDSRHLLSLFDPSLAYPRGSHNNAFLASQGWLGSTLRTAGWHMQLRPGLLYSGIVAIPISLFMAIVRPSRVTVFCAATALFSFTLIASPYFYHWFSGILGYHSPWRISVIIFHPLILAVFLTWLIEQIRNRRRFAYD